jgi:hypothetical protein
MGALSAAVTTGVHGAVVSEASESFDIDADAAAGGGGGRVEGDGAQAQVDRADKLVPASEKGLAAGIHPDYDPNMTGRQGETVGGTVEIEGGMKKAVGPQHINVGPAGVEGKRDTQTAVILRHEYDHADKRLSGKHPVTNRGPILENKMKNGTIERKTVREFTVEAGMRMRDAKFAESLGDYQEAKIRRMGAEQYLKVINDYVDRIRLATRNLCDAPGSCTILSTTNH